MTEYKRRFYELFYDAYNGFYTADEGQIYKSLHETNISIMACRPVPMRSFYLSAGIDINADKIREIDQLGWSMDMFEYRGYIDWGSYMVDITIKHDVIINGRVCNELIFYTEPGEEYRCDYDIMEQVDDEIREQRQKIKTA